MNVDNLKETKERAMCKVFAKLCHLDNEIKECQENIDNKTLSKVGITVEMHESILKGLYKQKQVWLYFSSLIT
tara:strand:+ start:477 stop:695 length:219 start_codon:yes stop_codon:yes gene_type:complete